MAKMVTFHDGAKFKAETNPLFRSVMIHNKCSGSYAYLRGDQVHKLDDALIDGWNKFGFDADGDEVWQWIWTNCGFHRLASKII